MFKIFKLPQRVDKLDRALFYNLGDVEVVQTKLFALEEYLDIEFFHGDKSKPHYRKKRVIKKPVGRPRKKK